VRVRVERDRDLTVAELLGDDLRVDAPAEEQARGRVPEIVESHARQGRPIECLVEQLRQVARIEGPADRVRENEAEIVPGGASPSARWIARYFGTSSPSTGVR